MNRFVFSSLLIIAGLFLAGCQNQRESAPAAATGTNADSESRRVAESRADLPVDSPLAANLPSVEAQSNLKSADDQRSNERTNEVLQEPASERAGAIQNGLMPETKPETEAAPENDQESSLDFPEEYKTPLPQVSEDWIRLHNFYEIWIDAENKTVIAGGRICLSEGRLEMFACPEGTKEHESIVSVWCKSHMIHAGLLAIEVEPGHPVEWEQTGILWDQPYSAATGPEIEIEVTWLEDGKPVTRRAQDMMLHASSGGPMKEPFVFAGSRTVVDENTGKNMYLADDGELVCVSNFSTAMIDLPVKSSASNENLEYIANPKMIPRVGTRVLVSFRPANGADSSKDEPSPSEPGGQEVNGQPPQGARSPNDLGK